MIKKSIFLLLLTLSFAFTGCVERGQSVGPQYVTTKQADVHRDTSKRPVYMLHLNANDDIDPVQNSIAGTFMVLIGLIILL